MPKRFTAATVITVALALSACGGGSENADSSEPRPATGGTSTVEDGPDPSEPRATEPSTTTRSTTEPSTTTTEPAPTTTEPTVEDQVREASARVYDLYWSCLREPDTCEVGTGYLPQSDAFRAFTNTVNDLVAGGLFVGEESVGYMVIESVEVRDDHTAVTSCWWATGVLYLLAADRGRGTHDPERSSGERAAGRSIRPGPRRRRLEDPAKRSDRTR